MKRRYFDTFTGAEAFAKQIDGKVKREQSFGRVLYYVEYREV